MPVNQFPIAETVAELKKLRRKLDGTSVAPRIDMLIALRSRQAADVSGAADQLDLPVRTLRRWWALYRDGGLAALLGKKNHLVAAEPRNMSPGTASDRTIPEHVVAMLNALPDRADAIEWIEQFRQSLITLFGDIDRITMNIGFASQPKKDGPRRADIMVIHHVGEENRRGRSAIVTSKMSSNPRQELLATMVANGFPVHLYRSPYLYDYYREDGAFLGTFILWREVGASPVSQQTLSTFAALEPFFRFMLSDHIARLQAANPQLKSFTDQVTMIAREHGLTSREHEVLIHYLVGRSYKEIADHLAISLAAVRKRIEAVHTKTGTRTTAELVARFFAPIRERV